MRLPPSFDPAVAAYKEWLHLNVFDPRSGAIGLFNASLHGDPRHHQSVAVGAALVHLPGRGWLGSVEVVPQRGAVAGISSIATGSAAVAVDSQTGIVAASARTAELSADMTAAPAAEAIDLPGPVPFGSGWIGWTVVPRLHLTGEMQIGDVRLDLGQASCYHDHNWGRWYWGDDVGWDWAALLAPAPAPVLVVSRATNRAHSEGSWRLTVAGATTNRSFTGRRLRVTATGRYQGPLRRLPGATAAAQTGRGQPALPGGLLLEAAAGADRIEAEVRVIAAAQLVLADPSRPGYSYLHQLAVSFSARGRIGGQDLRLDGLGVVERLD